MKQSNLAKIFKALSSEQRLKLFMMIYENRTKRFDVEQNKSKHKCCFGLDKAFTMACDCLSISRSTISHHFKELQNAGLIKCTRQGQSFYCEVNDEIVEEIRDFLK